MIVLMVEDEPFTAMVLEIELVAEGHRVLGPVATVKDAEALISSTRPDIALVDINLQGGGDSLALARRLTRSGIATLFTTGQVDTARANADAACGVIAKPYDPQTVIQAISILQQIAASREPVMVPAKLELFERPGAKSRSA